MLQVGLDSQCLSYLIDAWRFGRDPVGSLAAEQLSLTRLFFYLPDTLWTTRTVVDECARIREEDRAALHKSFIAVLFGELPLRSPSDVDRRSDCLATLHSGEGDRRIVAEAEDVGHTHLLTNDRDFIAHLSSATRISVLRPSEAWASLAPNRGARPNKVPEASNPLAREIWWHW